ncbi:MAG: methyl-accepting chemotaxis protein [Myxococcales bacterium]|nr:methyl-accepting chemotaxis protein [Myxococcales bacterium]
MPGIARRSISRKLTLTVLLTSGASLLLACLVFVLYDVVTLRRAMTQDAGTLARVIGINSAVALTFDDPSAASETLGALSAADSVLAAVIYDADGDVFSSYTAPGLDEAGFVPPAIGPEGARFDGPHLEITRDVVFNGKAIGTIFIRRDTRELGKRIERYVGIVLALLVAVAAVAAAISARLQRTIAWPLAELASNSEAIADGDLSTHVEASSDDELGVLARAFNAMVLGLRGLVGEVRQSIGDVSEVSDALRESSANMTLEVQRQMSAVADTADSAEQVRTSSLDVNANVEQLAVAARETSSSIYQMEVSIGEIAGHMDHLNDSIDTTSTAVNEVAANIDEVVGGVETLQNATDESLTRLDQLSASVRQVKDNAEESHALSEDTSQEASKGMKAVSETIAAMKEISTSFEQLEGSVSRLAEQSNSIDEIIQVISEVAEQTSLLSLNASIIAAQAGEHGKPFSVVAEQVKSLANRTHRSTQEIAQLIRSIQHDTSAAVTAVEEGSAKVEKGVQRSNVAGEVLGKIIEKSQNSTARVREIADATARQSGDLERVDRAMNEVKQIVEAINRSTRDQHRATAEIANAVQNIRRLGEDVRRSTDEQREGSGLITNAVNNVAERLNQIAEATQAQTKSCETIHQALSIFRDVMEEATLRTEAINAMVARLLERSQQLGQEIGRFKTD